MLVGAIVCQSLTALPTDALGLLVDVMPGTTYSAQIGACNAQCYIALQRLSQDLGFEDRAAAKKEIAQPGAL